MFLDPAVREVLENNIVEARLHTDGEAHIERIKELQESLADGNVTVPNFAIVNPKTGERIDKFDAKVALDADELIERLSAKL